MTGFISTVLLAAKQHGFGTAENMYKWIKDGVEPPKVVSTSGVLMDRTNYQQVLKEMGLD